MKNNSSNTDTSTPIVENEITSSVQAVITWDDIIWKVLATTICILSIFIFVKTLLVNLKVGNGVNRNVGANKSKTLKLKIPFTGKKTPPIVPKFWREVADYQGIGATVVIVFAIYGASLSYEEAEQFISSLSYEGLKHSLSLFRLEVLSYRNSYFPNVDKTPLPSATINLVDVASVQSKDSIPSTLSKDHEGFSPKATFYITAYVCVAIICFVATGYFPFLYLFGYNKKFNIINNF